MEPKENETFDSLPNLVKILFLTDDCPDFVTVTLKGPPSLRPLEKKAPEFPEEVEDLLPDGI